MLALIMCLEYVGIIFQAIDKVVLWLVYLLTLKILHCSSSSLYGKCVTGLTEYVGTKD
jgi:hypothetical protein